MNNIKDTVIVEEKDSQVKAHCFHNKKALVSVAVMAVGAIASITAVLRGVKKRKRSKTA